jgi:hypothetical protein
MYFNSRQLFFLQNYWKNKGNVESWDRKFNKRKSKIIAIFDSEFLNF